MSEPPVLLLAYPPVLLLSPSASRSPVPGAKSTTSSATKPLISIAARQREGTVIIRMLNIRTRRMQAKDRIQGLQRMIIDLQGRGKALKLELKGMAIRLKEVEANSNFLKVILATYLVTQGVSLDNLSEASTTSKLVVDKKEGDLRSEDINKKLSASVSDVWAFLYLTIS
ncbi:hypothetical protein OPQ81_002469 [Rhizoctonia solani]|nr:hypothetical protein OPQ81_002469 [Rhizoctonia solani]